MEQEIDPVISYRMPGFREIKQHADIIVEANILKAWAVAIPTSEAVAK